MRIRMITTATLLGSLMAAAGCGRTTDEAYPQESVALREAQLAASQVVEKLGNQNPPGNSKPSNSKLSENLDVNSTFETVLQYTTHTAEEVCQNLADAGNAFEDGCATAALTDTLIFSHGAGISLKPASAFAVRASESWSCNDAVPKKCIGQADVQAGIAHLRIEAAVVFVGHAQAMGMTAQHLDSNGNPTGPVSPWVAGSLDSDLRSASFDIKNVESGLDGGTAELEASFHYLRTGNVTEAGMVHLTGGYAGLVAVHVRDEGASGGELKDITAVVDFSMAAVEPELPEPPKVPANPEQMLSYWNELAGTLGVEISGAAFTADGSGGVYQSELQNPAHALQCWDSSHQDSDC